MAISIGDPTFSADLLEMYFGNDSADREIVRMTRPTISSQWENAVLQTNLNSPRRDVSPELSANEIYIGSNRDRETGDIDRDVFRSTRAAPGAPWSAPAYVGELNIGDEVADLGIQPGGRRAILGLRFGDAPAELYEATRTTTAGAWSMPVRLAELCSEFDDLNGAYTSDGLTVYFSSTREDGSTHDLYTASRPALDQPFTTPRAIEELNMPGVHDSDPWISPDGETLYFLRGNQLWEAKLVFD